MEARLWGAAPLHPVADPSPPTLYKHEAPIVELNRVTHNQGLAARRFAKKSAKFLLRLVSFTDPVLQQLGQGVQ
jgi:hypothetical protein